MKTKMSLSAEMDLTQDSVVQLTCWCGQIALHELWGLGRTRLDRITRRKELLGSQSLAVMMAAGRKACRQSLNVLNEESVRQKCADAMAAATGSNLSPLRSGYASALQSSPDMGTKDQGGR